MNQTKTVYDIIREHNGIKCIDINPELNPQVFSTKVVEEIFSGDGEEALYLELAFPTNRLIPMLTSQESIYLTTHATKWSRLFGANATIPHFGKSLLPPTNNICS